MIRDARERRRDGRRNRRPVTRWAALLAALASLALAGIGAPALAQSPAQPSLLTGVSASDLGPGQTQILLTFASPAPGFSILRDGSDKPGIAFALSSRGSGATTPPGLHGLLRAISFDQSDTVLILNFQATAQVKVTAAPVGDRSIAVTFTSAHAHAKGPVVADATPAGPLPRAVQRDPGEDAFEVVPLKYADVSEVVGLLTEGLSVKSNDSFTPQEPAFGSAGMGGQAQFASPPPVNPEGAGDPMAQSVDDTIAVDRRLNAIILKGSPEHIARLKEKIAAIDVPVKSVLLETVFVELDQSGARNVGLDFNNANGQVGVATLQGGNLAVAGSTALKPLTSYQLQAAIYAQVSNGHGRIVSKPRIAAQSGSTAKIVTGDALPILTAITLSGVNAVSQQVQYVNVGVTMQIAPRVSDDGFVTSHVFCVVSSVTGTSQGYPTISQREAETSATVHDGETFVIGGLTQESNIDNHSHVPILGEAPLVGQLFNLRTGTRSKTELYIVVTPHIVRPGDGTADIPPLALKPQ